MALFLSDILQYYDVCMMDTSVLLQEDWMLDQEEFQNNQ